MSANRIDPRAILERQRGKGHAQLNQKKNIEGYMAIHDLSTHTRTTCPPSLLCMKEGIYRFCRFATVAEMRASQVVLKKLPSLYNSDPIKARAETMVFSASVWSCPHKLSHANHFVY